MTAETDQFQIEIHEDPIHVPDALHDLDDRLRQLEQAVAALTEALTRMQAEEMSDCPYCERPLR